MAVNVPHVLLAVSPVTPLLNVLNVTLVIFFWKINANWPVLSLNALTAVLLFWVNAKIAMLISPYLMTQLNVSNAVLLVASSVFQKKFVQFVMTTLPTNKVTV